MAKILIVDDDEPLRTALQLMLENLGHETHVAGHGKDAFRHLAHSSFDLVMTDMFMPEMDGLEIIGKLQEQNPSLKIIAMSGGGLLNRSNLLRTAQRLGASQVLAKPFSRDELIAVLNHVLRSSPREPGPKPNS
jgi:CheY-like chemotaxis protein